MLRCLHDQARDRDDGYASGKKDPRVGLRSKVLERGSDRHEDKEPIEVHNFQPGSQAPVL